MGGQEESAEVMKAIMDRFLDYLEPVKRDTKAQEGLPAPKRTEAILAPINVMEFKSFLERLRVLNAEAALNALSNYRSRYLIVYVGPDRVGVLAELTRRLASLSCVVEGATMVVISGQVATMLVVSGLNNLAEAEVTSALDGVPASLFPSRPNVAAPPQVAAMRPREPGWPRPGSDGWHLYAEVPDRHGTLARITAIIGEHDVPLTSFGTWLSEGRQCVLDLNYAVQRDVDGDAIALEVREALVALGATVIRLYPSSQPVHSRADRFSPPTPGRAIVVTVLGRAEPGLVAAVTKGLSEDQGGHPRFNIVGSAMTILQGHIALALVVEKDRSVDAEVLDEVRTAASEYLDRARFDASVGDVFPLQQLPGRTVPSTKPTHQLRCVAPEQGGVLVAVAEALAEAGANILWVMASVVDYPVNGSSKTEFLVRLDIAAPSRRPERVDEVIANLRGKTEWQLDLSPWGAT